MNFCQNLHNEDAVNPPTRRRFARQLQDVHLPIKDALLAYGVVEHLARAIAIRLRNQRGDDALSTIQQLHANGWTFVELVEHHKRNPEAWKHSADDLLVAEETLKAAGFPAELARRMVILHPVAMHLKLPALRETIQAFRRAGLTDQDLHRAGFSHPRAFLATPSDIHAWISDRKPGSSIHTQSFYTLTRLSTRTRRTGASCEGEHASRAPPPPPSSARQIMSSKPLRLLTAEETEKHTSTRDWRKEILAILQAVDPNAPTTAPPHLAWIWNGSTRAPAILNDLAIWVSLPKIILAASEQTASVMFFATLFKNTRFHEILRRSPEDIRVRVYAIRKYLASEDTPDPLTQRPDLLLYPWETMEEKEIRYRVNEIDHRGLPRTKPNVLRTLFLLSREGFHEALNKLQPPVARRF